VCQELTLKKDLPVHKVFMLDNFVRTVQQTPTPELLLQKPYITLETYNEINTFLSNLRAVDNLDCIVFDPLLSRGLAYYTGIIYEAEYIDKDIMPSSIAAGGRYDTMLDKLGTKGVIPAIGLSIGIERIVTILEAKEKKEYTIVPDVFIATVGKNMEIHKLKLACELRDKGISVDFVYNKNPKMRKQLDYVFNKKIQFMIVIGENEINNDTVNLKFIEEEKQITIPRKDICKYII
jgi:histidyl-tRNA synthetase